MKKSELRKIIKEELLKEARKKGPFDEYDLGFLAKDAHWATKDLAESLAAGLDEVRNIDFKHSDLNKVAKFVDKLLEVHSEVYAIEKLAQKINREVVKQDKYRLK